MTAGTAAAQPSSPIHRLLFGRHSAATATQLAERHAKALVDQAREVADTGRIAGLRRGEADRAIAQLNDARALLAPLDPDPVRTGLLDRIHSLSDQLAAELHRGTPAGQGGTAGATPNARQAPAPTDASGSVGGRSKSSTPAPSGEPALGSDSGARGASGATGTSAGHDGGNDQNQTDGKASGDDGGGGSGARGQNGPGGTTGSTGPRDNSPSSPDPQGTDQPGPGRPSGSDASSGPGGAEGSGTGSRGQSGTGD